MDQGGDDAFEDDPIIDAVMVTAQTGGSGRRSAPISAADSTHAG